MCVDISNPTHSFLDTMLNNKSTPPSTSTSSSNLISEGTGLYNPTFEMGGLSRHLILSKIMVGPCGTLLLLSSLLLFYLILRHFRSELRLYFSLLVYTTFQVFLVVVLISSPLVQLHSSQYCPLLGVLEHLATILPGYGVVMVTAARWICASYPLRYNKLLELRTQAGVVVVVVGGLVGLTCLPLAGLCQYSWRISVLLRSGGFCVLDREVRGYVTTSPTNWQSADLQTHRWKDGMDARHIDIITPGYELSQHGLCVQTRWLLVGIGYILPFSLVVLLYCLIIRVLYLHKQRKLGMRKKVSTTLNKSDSKPNSKTDYRPCSNSEYEPVPLSTKLSQFRTIGLDAIPWSVLVILTLSTLSALLWIPHIFLPQQYYDSELSSYLVVDLANGVMLAAVSCSPLAYILTTPNMRKEVRRMFNIRNIVGRRARTTSTNGVNQSNKLAEC